MQQQYKYNAVVHLISGKTKRHSWSSSKGQWTPEQVQSYLKNLMKCTKGTDYTESKI